MWTQSVSSSNSSGSVVVGVHQVVRDLSGKVLLDRMVQHVYSLKEGLIQSMEHSRVISYTAVRL